MSPPSRGLINVLQLTVLVDSGFKFSQLEMSAYIGAHKQSYPLLTYDSAEVVLAVMLCSFRFSLGEKEIYWNMGGVNYPTVGKVDNKPAEFLKLQRIDN